MTQMLEWSGSTQYDTGTVSSFDLDDQGNCLDVHVGGTRLYYRVGKINKSDRNIDFGDSTYYANGTVTSIGLTENGNFVEVHVSSNNLYSRVAQANFDNKTIEWREGRQYDQYDTGYYCSVDVNNQNNCLEVHTGYSGLYYRVGRVDYTAKSIDWIRTGTLFSRGSYRNCTVALDNQGNCLVTYADKYEHLYSRVGKLNGNTVDWGESSEYNRGYLSNVALDRAGNCITTYVRDYRLYYCLGTVNIDSKTVTWGDSVQYSEDNQGRFSFTDVALDSEGNCFQTHVIAGSPNRLFYRSATLNVKQEWQQQFGSGADDVANAITVDPEGNIYATGTTLGQLGSSSYGKADAWVAKFDSEATQQWLKQIGTEAWDSSQGIATDSQGYVYITGYTSGKISGSTVSESDAWVIKLDPQGNEVWRKQIGTSKYDVANAVVVDEQGNVYLTGYTLDSFNHPNLPEKTSQASAWLGKFDSEGRPVWFKEVGIWGWTRASDLALGSDGTIYLTGTTNANIAAHDDTWIAKYDSEGNQQWLKHLCREGESAANAIAVDSQDNVYLAGYIKENAGELISGWADICIAKYDANGNQQWLKSLGGASEVDDAAHDITIDNQGNIYVTGHTEGSLNTGNFGGNDAWVAKLTQDGDVQWIKQIGTPADDYAFALAVSDEGDVYVTGKTAGDLGGTNAGDYDVFLVRVNP